MDDFWSNKNVMVTGTTGFLGGWLCRRLVDEGARITAIVRNSRPTSQFEIEAINTNVCPKITFTIILLIQIFGAIV